VEVIGNVKGTSRTSAFEVTTEDGKVVHSKLTSGQWPDAQKVIPGLKALGYT